MVKGKGDGVDTGVQMEVECTTHQDDGHCKATVVGYLNVIVSI